MLDQTNNVRPPVASGKWEGVQDAWADMRDWSKNNRATKWVSDHKGWAISAPILLVTVVFIGFGVSRLFNLNYGSTAANFETSEVEKIAGALANSFKKPFEEYAKRISTVADGANKANAKADVLDGRVTAIEKRPPIDLKQLEDKLSDKLMKMIPQGVPVSRVETLEKNAAADKAAVNEKLAVIDNDVKVLQVKLESGASAPAPQPTVSGDPLKDLPNMSGLQRMAVIMTTCNGRWKWDQDADVTAMQKAVSKYVLDQMRKILKTCNLAGLEGDTHVIMGIESAAQAKVDADGEAKEKPQGGRQQLTAQDLQVLDRLIRSAGLD